VRGLLRVALIAIGLLFCLPPHALARAMGRRSPWPRRFERWVGRVAGLRIRTVGRPAAAPVLFVANHVSWLDILAIGGATGSAFIAKSEIARWPLIGWLARQGRTVFVERERRGAVLAQAEEVVAALGSGRALTLFAEGTTGNGIVPLPFRPSLLAAVAGRSGVAVQPLALRYDDPEAQGWPSDEPAGRNAWKLLNRPHRTDLTMIFMEPIDPAGLDRKTLAARTEALVAAALAR
jgi:lyso-ornithine lipid O-acyltransferase